MRSHSCKKKILGRSQDAPLDIIGYVFSPVKLTMNGFKELLAGKPKQSYIYIHILIGCCTAIIPPLLDTLSVGEQLTPGTLAVSFTWRRAFHPVLWLVQKVTCRPCNLLLIEFSYGKWSIYRWFMINCPNTSQVSKMMIFHGYVKLSEGRPMVGWGGWLFWGSH